MFGISNVILGELEQKGPWEFIFQGYLQQASVWPYRFAKRLPGPPSLTSSIGTWNMSRVLTKGGWSERAASFDQHT